MTYCRYCGREITYKRTKNDKWMPVDVTGSPQFCEAGGDTQKRSGLVVCKKCGKPCFTDKSRRLIDYTTLSPHSCKTADTTRYKKYLARSRKTNQNKN